jgi:hypothetical protein
MTDPIATSLCVAPQILRLCPSQLGGHIVRSFMQMLSESGTPPNIDNYPTIKRTTRFVLHNTSMETTTKVLRQLHFRLVLCKRYCLILCKLLYRLVLCKHYCLVLCELKYHLILCKLYPLVLCEFYHLIPCKCYHLVLCEIYRLFRFSLLTTSPAKSPRQVLLSSLCNSRSSITTFMHSRQRSLLIRVSHRMRAASLSRAAHPSELKRQN